MQDLVRTTITLPNNLLQEVKIRAVEENITLSKLIRRILTREIAPEKKKKLHVNVGKYAFGAKSTFSRKDIYAEHLKRKLSA